MARQLNIIRPIIAAATLAVALVSLALPADARGGGSRIFAWCRRTMDEHGPQFAGGRRHGNDAYIKAASEDRDRLLANQIKSICRGC